jgi:hypothetical protein
MRLLGATFARPSTELGTIVGAATAARVAVWRKRRRESDVFFIRRESIVNAGAVDASKVSPRAPENAG